MTRTSGALVADRRGMTVSYSLMTLQERGTLFVGPGEEVYEGMIIGENTRSEDLDVNPVKEKHLTNMRSSTSDVLVRLDAHRKLTLDEALEFVREDEAVEATPQNVRMRKVVLEKVQRLKAMRDRAQVSGFKTEARWKRAASVRATVTRDQDSDTNAADESIG